jgi:hypothetical protein
MSWLHWLRTHWGLVLLLFAYVAAVILIVRILVTVTRAVAVPLSASLTFTTSKGELGMPLTVEVGQSFNTKFHEWSGTVPKTGVEVTGPGPIGWMSDNPSVATIDPTSGAGVAVSAGTCNIVGSDSGDGLSASDALTVTAPTPKSASIDLVAA